MLEHAGKERLKIKIAESSKTLQTPSHKSQKTSYSDRVTMVLFKTYWTGQDWCKVRKRVLPAIKTSYFNSHDLNRTIITRPFKLRIFRLTYKEVNLHWLSIYYNAPSTYPVNANL